MLALPCWEPGTQCWLCPAGNLALNAGSALLAHLALNVGSCTRTHPHAPARTGSRHTTTSEVKRQRVNLEDDLCPHASLWLCHIALSSARLRLSIQVIYNLALRLDPETYSVRFCVCVCYVLESKSVSHVFAR
jgi:hypothetical protein